MNRICGAKTRGKSQETCKKRAMVNGRCALHGGKSTGSKTIDGRISQKMSNWKHGNRSKEAIEECRVVSELIRDGKLFISDL